MKSHFCVSWAFVNEGPTFHILQRGNSLCPYFPSSSLVIISRQTIVNAKLDGDEKVQELSRRCRSVCAQEPEQPRQLELDAEDRWRAILRGAQAARDSAEKQMAREHLSKQHEESRRLVRDWLEDQRRDLNSLRVYEDPQVAIQTAQVSDECVILKVSEWQLAARL